MDGLVYVALLTVGILVGWYLSERRTPPPETPLLKRLSLLEGERGAHNASVEWLRAHVNRLEQERALLLSKLLSADVLAPRIEAINLSAMAGRPIADPTETQRAVDAPANIPAQQIDGALFDDIGDDEARRHGIGWNPDGTLGAAS